MIEQTSHALTFFFQFQASGQGKTGLTPTANITRINGVTPTIVATDLACAEVNVFRHPGLYVVSLAASDTLTAGDYLATAHTTDVTVDAQDVPAMWSVGRAGVDKLETLATGRITVTYPILASNAITLIAGNDYTASANRPLQWIEDASAGWPTSLAGASINFHAVPIGTGSVFDKAGSVITNDKVQVELTRAETASLNIKVGAYVYSVIATLTGGDVVTLARGRVTVE